ncbi:ABC transporter substrate-binding protein [Sphingomonas sp.]|uniref:ABC transporter substrate-binding protein n=1 Tax=Sphingomonas sp. TaxID=28214 RepID=UPI0025DDDCA4|nr:ABC transporter substrate-binding protein [Sphingomonas sp.]
MIDWRGPIFSMTMLVALAGCAPHPSVEPAAAVSPIAVSGSTATIEIAPVLLAARDLYPAGAVVSNGGIPNLFDPGRPADIATHAETQALRYSVAHPDIRIILTVTEGRYRIIARRSAGIRRIADLKGKRIATLTTTSAGYFLARMLARAGLAFADVTPVRISPLDGIPAALERREVDAVAIWEPHGGNAARALGDDIVIFSGDGVYRELFNLNTTAADLADPAKRRRITEFVRAVIVASARIRRDPTPAQALVTTSAGFSAAEVADAWPTLSFPAALPADLLDELVAQEEWLATQDRRPPRPREVLSRLIDPSIYKDALAMGPISK